MTVFRLTSIRKRVSSPHFSVAYLYVLYFNGNDNLHSPHLTGVVIRSLADSVLSNGPFTFLSYAGSWRDNFQRAAHECKVQHLLTPTWKDPHFPYPIESEAMEWGWNLQPEEDNVTQCYR